MKLFVRADAGTLIGGGHVLRCLTLAGQLLQAGGECRFASAELPPPFRRRIEESGFQVCSIPFLDPGARGED